MLSKNQVKYLNSLRLVKFREMNRVFLAEGIKLVDDLIDSHFRILTIFSTREWIESRWQILADKNIAIQEITSEELKKVSNLVTPNEVLAVVGIPEPSDPSPEAMGNIILLLDRVQDPGNFGTIIRTADWFGIKHIFCSEGTADLYNSKVVQATMGSICRVNVHYTDLGQLMAGMHDSRNIYGTFANGKNIYQIEPLFPAVVVIGNESKGISEEYYPYIKEKIGIPSFSSSAESLNASVATGIVCSEFCRRLV